MEKLLARLAHQLDALDEASLMSLWSKYAALVSPETEIEDIFVRSDAAAAEDAVVACAREEEYIRYVAERSGR